MEILKIEQRADGGVNLYGYVNAVERDSKLLPPTMAQGATRDFVERIHSGVFGEALKKNPDVKLMFNHERAVEKASLKLEEDNIGLKAEVHLYDAEIAEYAKAGKLTGWSFGFRDAKDEWENCGDFDRRYIDGLWLDEVSILTKTPAYDGTQLDIRALEEARDEQPAEEEPKGIPTDIALKIIYVESAK